jgi:hypothetical protein
MFGEEWLASMVPRVFKPSEELEARQFQGHFLDDSGRVQSTFTCQCFGLNEAFNGTQAHSDTHHKPIGHASI